MIFDNQYKDSFSLWQANPVVGLDNVSISSWVFIGAFNCFWREKQVLDRFFSLPSDTVLSGTMVYYNPEDIIFSGHKKVIGVGDFICKCDSLTAIGIHSGVPEDAWEVKKTAITPGIRAASIGLLWL